MRFEDTVRTITDSTEKRIGFGGSLRAKLRSSSGASLLFALLLFLVCITVGSVILTSGTAAAGRASQAASMERNYSAVSSAAELLCSEFEGNTLTVVREKEEETHTERELHRDILSEEVVSAGSGDPETTVSYRMSVNGDPFSKNDTFGKDFFADSALALTLGADFAQKVTVTAVSEESGFSKITGIEGYTDFDSIFENPLTAGSGMSVTTFGNAEIKRSFILSAEDADAGIPDVQADCVLAPNGTMTITLSGGTGADAYQTVLVLRAVVSDPDKIVRHVPDAVEVSDKIEDKSTSEYDAFIETTTSKTITTRTLSVRWVLESIKKAERSMTDETRTADVFDS